MLHFGITPEHFRSEVFEKTVHLRKAALRQSPLAWSDLDELLLQIEPGEPVVKLFNQGLVPQPHYTDETVELGQRRRRLNKVKFYEQMRKGATLVLNRFENYSIAARRLCAETARFAGLQTMSNAYLSFGGSGTFGKHWDTHDVFAIQLIGRKRWQVFAPTFPLPLSSHSSERVSSETVTQPVLDCVLEPGDLLYVPRGWWHQALPLDEGSFHLSVGAYAATVHDYLVWLCSRYLPGIPSARAAFDASGSQNDSLAELTRKLSTVLRDPAVQREFQRELVQRERLNSEFQLGLFLDPRSSGLRGDELISLTSCYRQDGELAEIPVNGTRMRLDSVSQAILGALQASALTFDALCRQIGPVPRDRLHRTVLDLVQHEVVTIAERS